MSDQAKRGGKPRELAFVPGAVTTRRAPREVCTCVFSAQCCKTGNGGHRGVTPQVGGGGMGAEDRPCAVGVEWAVTSSLPQGRQSPEGRDKANPVHCRGPTCPSRTRPTARAPRVRWRRGGLRIEWNDVSNGGYGVSSGSCALGSSGHFTKPFRCCNRRERQGCHYPHFPDEETEAQRG